MCVCVYIYIYIYIYIVLLVLGKDGIAMLVKHIQFKNENKLYHLLKAKRQGLKYIDIVNKERERLSSWGIYCCGVIIVLQQM